MCQDVRRPEHAAHRVRDKPASACGRTASLVRMAGRQSCAPVGAQTVAVNCVFIHQKHAPQGQRIAVASLNLLFDSAKKIAKSAERRIRIAPSGQFIP